MFVYHMAGQKIKVPTKEAWLEALKLQLHNPKPPEWWLNAQLLKGRVRTQASIVWASRYDTSRKWMAWMQAPMRDFQQLGYHEEW